MEIQIAYLSDTNYLHSHLMLSLIHLIWFLSHIASGSSARELTCEKDMVIMPVIIISHWICFLFDLKQHKEAFQCFYVVHFCEKLALVLLAANLANTKWRKKPKKGLEPWHIGTHLRVLNESYQINTNMTGFRWFSKIFCDLVFWSKAAPALEGLAGHLTPHFY